MNAEVKEPFPPMYGAIIEATRISGFNMASDLQTCSVLRTLAASKPAGRFLELGTGTGLATSWILDGMDSSSSLVTIDNDKSVLAIAQDYLGSDVRVEIVLTDGEAWLKANRDLLFDYIFADTWHGKYLLLEETLAMLPTGGLYIIDDMLPQPNWPDGHAEKALALVEKLENHTELVLTKLNWSTGLVIAVKK